MSDHKTLPIQPNTVYDVDAVHSAMAVKLVYRGADDPILAMLFADGSRVNVPVSQSLLEIVDDTLRLEVQGTATSSH